MYNLLVSGCEEEWNGKPFQIELSRCIREYTNDEITQIYGELDAGAIDAIRKMPCVFAYETGPGLNPKFGFITNITKRQDQVRIEYEILPVDSFLSSSDLRSFMFELDISKWELNRTHWAVKNVDLPKELNTLGIVLPNWTRSIDKSVDITTHSFDVGLSFPGDVRSLVESIAHSLERLIGPDAYFYDNNYVAQLARPSLNLLLEDIYRNRSKLIVVFLSAQYQNRNWCGIEFRAILDMMFERKNRNRIMYIRTDDGCVDGVLSTDGYLDARDYRPSEIAEFIHKRLKSL